jgi:hypothetical protein
VSEAYEEIAAIVVRDPAYAARIRGESWDVRREPGGATATGWQRCSDISDSKSRAAAILMPTMHKPSSP